MKPWHLHDLFKLIGNTLGASARRLADDGKDIARRLRPAHPPVQPGPPESFAALDGKEGVR